MFEKGVKAARINREISGCVIEKELRLPGLSKHGPFGMCGTFIQFHADYGGCLLED